MSAERRGGGYQVRYTQELSGSDELPWDHGYGCGEKILKTLQAMSRGNPLLVSREQPR